MKAFILLSIGFASVMIFTGTLRSHHRNPWLEKFSIHVAQFDMRDKSLEFTPALPKESHQSFEAMVGRLKPIGAINGTFYDSSGRVLGDVVIDGRVVRRGGQRHAVAVTPRGKIRFLHRGKGSFDWRGIKSGLASGPLLVSSGRIALDPVADGFKPRSKTLKAWRSAVGATGDGKLLLVSVAQDITLDQLANIMVALGARDAINLDGGGATALFHHGKVAVKPTLPMTNILIVSKKQ